MRVAVASDEQGPLEEAVIAHLVARGEVVVHLGRGAEWPEVGRLVGEAVADGTVERGVVCCWTGTGVSIAANKVTSVRAALCADASIATGARRWNDANVLALAIATTTPDRAAAILDAFLDSPCDDGERTRIDRLESGMVQR